MRHMSHYYLVFGQLKQAIECSCCQKVCPSCQRSQGLQPIWPLESIWIARSINHICKIRFDRTTCCWTWTDFRAFSVSSDEPVGTVSQLLYPPSQYEWNVNQNASDHLIGSFDPDRGFVALPKGQPNMLPSEQFPWDESKEVFVLSGFHSLHSLVGLTTFNYLFI